MTTPNNTHGIKIGDRVSWTQVSSKGRSISISEKEGKVIKIDLKGNTIVQMKNNRKTGIAIGELTPQNRGVKNGTTKFFDALCQAHGLGETKPEDNFPPPPVETSHPAL